MYYININKEQYKTISLTNTYIYIYINICIIKVYILKSIYIYIYTHKMVDLKEISYFMFSEFLWWAVYFIFL